MTTWAVVASKTCLKCKLEKSASEFTKNKSGRHGLYSHCRDCKNESWRVHYKKNRTDILERSKWAQLKYYYQISKEDYIKLLAKQNGVCAVCHQTQRYKKSLAVDHCHKTNMVRGLLCDSCNRGIGFFEDNIERLSGAIKYLEESCE